MALVTGGSRGIAAATVEHLAREAFFAVTVFRFTNAEGQSRHGRFRIRPEAGTE